MARSSAKQIKQCVEQSAMLHFVAARLKAIEGQSRSSNSGLVKDNTSLIIFGLNSEGCERTVTGSFFRAPC